MNYSSESKQYKGEPENERKELNKSGTVYRCSGNLFISKEVFHGVPHNFIASKRGDVLAFSAGAGARMRSYLRECLSEYRQMVTLTYPFCYPTNGVETKEHLRRFLQELRREYGRSKGIIDEFGGREQHSSFWFLEFQQRGAPHYHIFTTWAPAKEWVAATWYRICNSEDPRHLRAGTRTEFLRTGRAGTISYASKYAAKLEQKEVPEGFEKVGRFWGITGRRSRMSADAFVGSSKADFDETYSARKNMFWLLQSLVTMGEAEVFIRKEGVLVARLNTVYAEKKMRMAVSRVGASSRYHEAMFEDADLDFGEGYA